MCKLLIFGSGEKNNSLFPSCRATFPPVQACGVKFLSQEGGLTDLPSEYHSLAVAEDKHEDPVENADQKRWTFWSNDCNYFPLPDSNGHFSVAGGWILCLMKGKSIGNPEWLRGVWLKLWSARLNKNPITYANL